MDREFEVAAEANDAPMMYEEYQEHDDIGDPENMGYNDYGLEDASMALPPVVKTFIQYFYKNILDKNVYELHSVYETSFNKITAKYYARERWPEAEQIAPLVNRDSVFICLYKELYYRHVYNKLQPTLKDREDSYRNYADLFNYLLNSDGPVDIELPNQWLWDIVDEFIYQYQDYCRWRSRSDHKGESAHYFTENDEVIWSYNDVLNVLCSLVSTSQVNEQLQAQKLGESVTEAAGEFGCKTLYKMLGYFGLVGLLRLHVLFGDYHLALSTMSLIELNKRGPIARVTACQVTAYYYVGFCYMALRRYTDAIKRFSYILPMIQRTKQYLNRSYQYDEIVRKSGYMYDMLAMCQALSPQRIDEGLQQVLREGNENYQKLTRSPPLEALQAFGELYMKSCPKFVSPLVISDGSKKAHHLAPVFHQRRIFLCHVYQMLSVPNLKSLLKLYTTIDTGKIATLMELGKPCEEIDVGKLKKVTKGSNSLLGEDKKGDDEDLGDDGDENTGSSAHGQNGADGHSSDYVERLSYYESLDDAAKRQIANDECHRQLMLFKLKTRQRRWESDDLLQGNYGMISELDFVIDNDIVRVTETKQARRVGDWFVRHIVKFNEQIGSLQSKLLTAYAKEPAKAERAEVEV